RARTGEPGDVEPRGRVLEHRQVPHLEDVPQVPGVRGGAGGGLVPRLVARAAGELGQRLPAVRVGRPRHVAGREAARLREQLALLTQSSVSVSARTRAGAGGLPGPPARGPSVGMMSMPRAVAPPAPPRQGTTDRRRKQGTSMAVTAHSEIEIAAAPHEVMEAI